MLPDALLPLPDLLRRAVLVVEDDFFLAQLLAEEFEMSGAEVVGPAATVTDALMLVGATPHLAVATLDVDLQGDAVYPVADALLERRVPFIFLTAYEPAALAKGYRLHPVITKPASIHRIMNALIG